MVSDSVMRGRSSISLIFSIAPLGIFLWHVLISVYEQSVNQAVSPWARFSLDIVVFICLVVSATSLTSHTRYRLSIVLMGVFSVCLSASWVIVDSTGASIGGGLLAFVGWLILTLIGAFLAIVSILDIARPAETNHPE